MSKAIFPNERGELFPQDELGPLALKESGYGIEELQKFKICPSDSEPVCAWCVTTCDTDLPKDWIAKMMAIKVFCLHRWYVIDGGIRSDRATEAMDFMTLFINQCGHNRAERFQPGGRGPGPIRKLIAKLLNKNPALKNPDLWEMVCKKLPKGWSAFPDPIMGGEPYLEGALNQTMGKSRFFNICGEERKKITG